MSVISYNLMAPHLERNNAYSQYLPCKVRLPKLLNEVEKQIQQFGIICLQEIDQYFEDTLIPIFEMSNYEYLIVPYGEHGALIAFPSDYYTCAGSGYIRVGELIEGNCPASRAKNKLIWVDLIDKCSKKNIYVFNYHMPLCKFRRDEQLKQVMKVVEIIDITAQNSPVILCVDLNSLPSSNVYKYITKHLNDARRGDFATSVNVIERGGVRFKGCIDYIFVRKIKVESLYVRPALSIIPSVKEGSDHTPLLLYFK